LGTSQTKRLKGNILKYELIIRNEAELEITEASIYYETRQVGLGKRFLAHLQVYLDRIQTYPEHFSIKRKPYREAFIKKFPYLIIYEITKGKVIVYSVFNIWQNPEKKKK